MERTSIQLIRNATLKINYAGTGFLLDPVLSPKQSFMSFVDRDKNLNPTVDLPCTPEEVVQDVDAVLVTHSHPDHFDEKAKEVLDKDLPLFVQPADFEMVKELSFTKVTAVNDTVSFANVTITRTGGKHGPEELLPHLGEVSGYVLKADNHPTIYIVGDSIYNEEVESALTQHNPDIIVTFSGGAVLMGDARILMNEVETCKVAKFAPKATVVAVHMEALDHCRTTRAMVRQVANEENLKILTPADGETVCL